MEFEIYTDGATSNNGHEGAKGGWAFIILKDNQIFLQGAGLIELGATNNICELEALIQACRRAPVNATCTVYSDSAYCINCYTQKWYKKWQQNGWVNSKRQSVANRDLWEQLIPFFEDPRFEFKKCTGHSTNKWNNFVDALAVSARQ